MKSDRVRGPHQRHVWLRAFGWTPDGYEPRHALSYREESERVGRGRHRADVPASALKGWEAFGPLLQLARP